MSEDTTNNEKYPYGYPKKFPSKSLVGIGCALCGETFRIPRDVSNEVGSPDFGFGVSVDRYLDPIKAKEFAIVRVEDNDVLDKFVIANKRCVSFHLSWSCHADNMDMCPKCALILLQKTIEHEIDIYDNIKSQSDNMGQAIVSPFEPDKKDDDEHYNLVKA